LHGFEEQWDTALVCGIVRAFIVGRRSGQLLGQKIIMATFSGFDIL